MRPTEQLHAAGQSLWLDNITRDMLVTGELDRYLVDYTITGLTSNPSIFEKAFAQSDAYDEAIAAGAASGRRGEDLFFDLAVRDLQDAADVFAPIHERTRGVDGWVSLEVSPLLAYNTDATIAAASDVHARADRRNLYVKIPGTPEGLPAIEEAVFRGIPINVTLLFSVEHYLAAADAHLRGVERRIAAGLDPDVRSVASVFISRWDSAVASSAPAELRGLLALAVGRQAYRAYRDFVDSDRFAAAANAGARPQRLLFASTSTKDPALPDTLYVEGLAARDTINTMPDATVRAFADHGDVGELLRSDGGDSAQVLKAYDQAGIDVAALGRQLQIDGAAAFVASWKALLDVVGSKAAAAS